MMGDAVSQWGNVQGMYDSGNATQSDLAWAAGYGIFRFGVVAAMASGGSVMVIRAGLSLAAAGVAAGGIAGGILRSPGELGSALGHINPGFTPEDENCVSWAIATDQNLAGTYATAAQGGPGTMDNIEAYAGNSAQAVGSADDIVSRLTQSGPGSSGIVVGYPSDGFAHAFNATNVNGSVYFIDGQSASFIDPGQFDFLDFVPTR
jgi:hypothetical protein